MSTPIEIVREYIPKIEYTRTFYGREREEVLTALASVLRDAERLSCAEVLTRDDVGNDGEGYATGVPELGEGDVIYIVRADRLREGK